MHLLPLLLAGLGLATQVSSQCPYAGAVSGGLFARSDDHEYEAGSRDHMARYEIDDSDGYMTSDVGGPIEDQNSLKAGIRGSTLLEDFILRQKITRFDHERVSGRP